MKIGEHLGKSVSMEVYRKVVEDMAERTKALNYANDILLKARGILDSRATGENINNAVSMLLSLPDYTGLQKYVTRWIIQNSESKSAYAKMVSEKCTKEKVAYKGLNAHPDWFVFEAFKDRAVRKGSVQFSLRFKEALVSFILDQQKVPAGSKEGTAVRPKPELTGRQKLVAIISRLGAHNDRTSANKPANGSQEAWKLFKKELYYYHDINLNVRIINYMNANNTKTAPKTSEMIRDDELVMCINTAIALCNARKVDISDIAGK